MASIKLIDKSSVHKICSGQVILDLSLATKELVENSLDAGATSVDIALVDYGLESLEVADNGKGIQPEDFEVLACKHATSKLNSFDDLENLQTFGFRGEALSSLSSVSRLRVCTASASSAPLGASLLFDTSGRLIERSSSAREKGTTVKVCDLFSTLPVRLAEFRRNKKREFSKCLGVVQAYAIIQPQVRFQMTLNSNLGTKVVLKTSGIVSKSAEGFTESMKGAIGLVFGPKFLQNLLKVDFKEPEGLSFQGFISHPHSNSARGSSDRQFLYVNKRPIQNLKLAKALNLIYRSFVPKLFPAFFLNVSLERNKYDLNVTPDKRTIFLHNELQLTEILCLRLTELLEPYRGTFQVSEPSNLSFALSAQGTASGASKVASIDEKAAAVSSTPNAKPPIQVSPLARRSLFAFGETRSASRGSENLQRSKPTVITASTERATTTAFKKAFGEVAIRRHSDQLAISGLVYRAARVSDSSENRLAKFQRHYKRHLSVVGKQVASADNNAASGFKSGVLQDEEEAVREFRRFIKKSDFLLMKVIGQFNMGFIVVMHRGKDLFVIDQHASDEKFNYERLCREYPVQSQYLIKPQLLQLSIQDELIVLEHLPLLKKNGFQIAHNPAKNELHLLTCPVTKRGALGIADLEELIYKLGKRPDKCYSFTGVSSKPGSGELSLCEAHKAVFLTDKTPLLQCTKLQGMFANMACRCSVMIGTTLSLNAMKKIVKNLSTLEQPWNCPHGRPTMRHIYDLKGVYQ